jgi:hypothetical protein
MDIEADIFQVFYAIIIKITVDKACLDLVIAGLFRDAKYLPDVIIHFVDSERG